MLHHHQVLYENGILLLGRCEGESCFQRRLSLGTRFAYNEKTEEIVCCGKAGTGKQTRLHTLFCSNPSVCRMYEAGMYLVMNIKVPQIPIFYY